MTKYEDDRTIKGKDGQETKFVCAICILQFYAKNVYTQTEWLSYRQTSS